LQECETNFLVKTNPLKCCMVKSSSAVSTHLSGTQLSGYLSGIHSRDVWAWKGYCGGSTTAAQAWRPCPLWEL